MDRQTHRGLDRLDGWSVNDNFTFNEFAFGLQSGFNLR